MKVQLLLLSILSCSVPGAQAIFFGRPLFPKIQCFVRMGLLRLDVGNFEKYDTYFRDDSVMTLAQAGSYYGADGIEEYVKFAYSEFSPYFASGPDSVSKTQFRGYDRDTGECNFLITYYATYEMDPIHTGSDLTYNLVNMLKVKFNYRSRYVSRMNVFYPESFLENFFGDFLNSDNTRDYICGVIQSDTRTGLINSTDSCSDDLAAMDVVDADNSHVEGFSQGCRALHAVFAETNDKHCAHISFEPMEDSSGVVKCQTTGSIEPEDLFDEKDFELYEERCVESGIDPEVGHNIGER